MTIKEIFSANKDQYIQFFQKALIEDEDSFRISPNDPVVFPTNDTPESFTLGAFDQDKLVGIVSFVRMGADREKLSHKGMLIRMLVDKTQRGKGIGKLLIQELINKARQIPGLEIINLTVVTHNIAAQKLYESFGFKTFASEARAIKWKGKYFGEDQMALRLN